MTFHATTTVDIYRGTTTDSFGDEVDTGAPLYTDIVASVIEQTKTVRNPDTRLPETIRVYSARLPPNTDILDDDRLRDRRTGRFYLVDGIQQLTNPAITPNMRIDLRRIT